MPVISAASETLTMRFKSSIRNKVLPMNLLLVRESFAQGVNALPRPSVLTNEPAAPAKAIGHGVTWKGLRQRCTLLRIGPGPLQPQCAPLCGVKLVALDAHCRPVSEEVAGQCAHSFQG
jgi:hypothetical protein